MEFFIRFRNKIEHRYSPIVEAVIAGKAQSYIVNFEEKVVKEFGQPESLGQSLRLPVFLTTLTEDAVAAVKNAFVLLPARIRNFITDYEGQLPDEVLNHSAYDFRLYLIPKTSSKAQADAAIEFVRLSDLTPEQREKVDESLVIIRDRQVGVANKGSMRPTQVTKAAQAQIPWKFRTTPEHFRASQHFKVKPPTGGSKTGTDGRYCVYDDAHEDYVYTQAWVDKLVQELQSKEGYRAVLDKDPVPK